MNKQRTFRKGEEFTYPLAANAIIALGDMVAMNAAGTVEPASKTAGLRVVGVATSITPSHCTVRKGCFCFDAAIADAPTLAQVGTPVFADTVGTIARTSTGGRPQAGTLCDIDALGFWVSI